MARTRIYKIVRLGGSHHRVVNAENHEFSVPAKDAIKIGEATTPPVEVTRSEMCSILRDVRGFFFLTFVKRDGSLRDMYAHVDGAPVGDAFPLVDLELDATAIRQCRMSSVVKIIKSTGELVVLKKSAFQAVLRDNRA